MTLNNNPEQVDPSSLSESENLTSVSLSAYECDSEREGSWSNIDSDDSDAEMRGTHEMNLKFLLDAAKAGECCCFCLADPTVNHIM